MTQLLLTNRQALSAVRVGHDIVCSFKVLQTTNVETPAWYSSLRTLMPGFSSTIFKISGCVSILRSVGSMTWMKSLAKKCQTFFT